MYFHRIIIEISNLHTILIRLLEFYMKKIKLNFSHIILIQIYMKKYKKNTKFLIKKYISTYH